MIAIETSRMKNKERRLPLKNQKQRYINKDNDDTNSTCGRNGKKWKNGESRIEESFAAEWKWHPTKKSGGGDNIIITAAAAATTMTTMMLTTVTKTTTTTTTSNKN